MLWQKLRPKQEKAASVDHCPLGKVVIIGPMLLNSSDHVDDVLDVVDGHVIDDVSNVLASIGVVDSGEQQGLA